MSNIVDQVTAGLAEQTATPAVEPIEIAAEEVVQPETDSEAEPAKSEDDVPFPKKAVNALSRRDKQIGKLRAEKIQLENQLREFQSSQQAPKKADQDSPKEADYDDFAEYMKAVTRYEIKQEMQEGNKKTLEDQHTKHEQAYVQELEMKVAERAKSFLDTTTDARDVFIENADILDSFPPHLERAFLEADDAAMAFYVLAKEGKLEELLQMSPARAAMEIGKAQERGGSLNANPAPKPVTSAPAPISANKANGTVKSGVENMSGDDILKSIRKR